MCPVSYEFSRFLSAKSFDFSLRPRLLGLSLLSFNLRCVARVVAVALKIVTYCHVFVASLACHQPMNR